MTDGEWKELPGYPWVSVSSVGEVRNERTGRTRKHEHQKGGRDLIVEIPQSTPRKRVKVSEIVLERYGPPRPEGLVPTYRNGDPGDLRIDNLEWGPKPSRSKNRKCDVPGCGRPHCAKGLCNTHWLQERDSKAPRCTIEGCTNPKRAGDLCSAHRRRERRGLPLNDKPLRAKRPPLQGDEWGQWCTSPDGYVTRYRWGSDGKKERQSQHRAVMEGSIGRPLYRTETVHHINGVRNDNRLENLELWSSSHPSGQRVADKITWAIDLLKTYAPEELKEEDV